MKFIWFIKSTAFLKTPSGAAFDPGKLLGVKAKSFDDVYAFADDTYGSNFTIEYVAGDSTVVDTYELPDDFKPAPAILVCEKHPHTVTRCETFRFQRYGDGCMRESQRYMAKLQEAYPHRKFLLTDEMGTPL